MATVTLGPNKVPVEIPDDMLAKFDAGKFSSAGLKLYAYSSGQIKDLSEVGLEGAPPVDEVTLGVLGDVKMGPLAAGMISAGKETARLGSNINQLAAELSGNQAEVERRKAEQQTMQDVTAPVREQFPKSSFVGSMLPYMAVPGGRAAQIGAGAISGALEGDTTGERLTGGALGAGASYAGQVVGDRIGRAVQNGVQSLAGLPKAAARSALAQADIPLTPGQRGSLVGRGTDIVKSTLLSYDPLKSQQISQLNRMAANVIGENVDELTPATLGRAHAKIGSMFEDAASAIKGVLPIDPDAAYTQAADAAAEAVDPSRLGGALKVWANNLEDGITGSRYNSLRSKLGKISMQLWQDGASTEAEVVDGMIDALDDALTKASPEAGEQLGKARYQWRFLTALRRASALDPEGNINVNSLNRALNAKYPGADVLRVPNGPAGDFIKTLKAYQSVVRPFRSSGTAERLAQLGVLGLAGAGYGAAGPEGAAVPFAAAAVPFMGGGAGGAIGGGLARGGTQRFLDFLLRDQQPQ